jgi:hypothetical protein
MIFDGTQMNPARLRRNQKILYWTQINTDEHRFYFGKRPKDKRLNGTRMNTDKIQKKLNKI